MHPAYERNTALSTLQTATFQLVQSMNILLIPPEGASFGFALRGARDSGGVAAVKGGMRTATGGGVTAGQCTFGTDDPLVRIILTAMKFDPVIRSAAILQYTDRVIQVFKNDLFLECAPLDATVKNQGITTMDWGIASCCKAGIPDVIFRRSPGREESRIIVFGEGPADVANNIIICSNRI